MQIHIYANKSGRTVTIQVWSMNETHGYLKWIKFNNTKRTNEKRIKMIMMIKKKKLKTYLRVKSKNRMAHRTDAIYNFLKKYQTCPAWLLWVPFRNAKCALLNIYQEIAEVPSIHFTKSVGVDKQTPRWTDRHLPNLFCRISGLRWKNNNRTVFKQQNIQ